jgi:hypothetical protein
MESQKRGESGAGHRVRTGDFQLGKPETTATISTAYLSPGTLPGTLPRTLLEAASAGQAERVLVLAKELARGVVATPEVALALRVLSGGEHALSAGIELAQLLDVQGEVKPSKVGS